MSKNSPKSYIQLKFAFQGAKNYFKKLLENKLVKKLQI